MTGTVGGVVSGDLVVRMCQAMAFMMPSVDHSFHEGHGFVKPPDAT